MRYITQFELQKFAELTNGGDHALLSITQACLKNIIYTIQTDRALILQALAEAETVPESNLEEWAREWKRVARQRINSTELDESI